MTYFYLFSNIIPFKQDNYLSFYSLSTGISLIKCQYSEYLFYSMKDCFLEIKNKPFKNMGCCVLLLVANGIIFTFKEELYAKVTPKRIMVSYFPIYVGVF